MIMVIEVKLCRTSYKGSPTKAVSTSTNSNRTIFSAICIKFVLVEFVVNDFVQVEFSLCTTQLAQISHNTIFVPGPCTTSFDDYSGFQPKITQPKHGLRAPLTGYCSNYKCNFLSCYSLLPHNFGKYKLTTFSNISRPIIVVHTYIDD